MGYEFGRNEVWNLEIEDKKETPQEVNKRLQKQGLWTRLEQEAWDAGRKQGYSDGCEDI